MMLEYILVTAAYLVGTFYLQKLDMFGGRRGTKEHYVISLFLYAAAFVIPVSILSDSLQNMLILSSLVFVTHFVYFAGQGGLFEARTKHLAFFVLTHAFNVILLLFSMYIVFSGSAAYSQIIEMLSSVFGDRTDVYSYLLLSVLVCSAPSSEFVMRIMDHYSPDCADEVKNNDPRLGSVIGIYERIFVIITGFMGWYVAIAFVVTAKSLARLKKFEERGFAERFIIGTFSSILIAVVLLFLMLQIF
jgi:hypothetical protein